MKNTRDDLSFVRSLLKGKIAEIIFQHMFQSSGQCIVLPFGYEHLTPILAQYQKMLLTKEDLENIRNTPDFILMKPDHTQMRLVDVKYRSVKSNKWVKQIAESIALRWNTAWVFLATPDGFYFSEARDVIKDDGEIASLRGRWVSNEIQEAYLRLLREFEQ